MCNSKIVLHVTKFEDDELFFFHIGPWHRDTKHLEWGCECVVMSSGIDHKALLWGISNFVFWDGGYGLNVTFGTSGSIVPAIFSRLTATEIPSEQVET